MKTCSRCLYELPATKEYFSIPAPKGGWWGWCRQCNREWDLLRYRAFPGKRLSESNARYARVRGDPRRYLNHLYHNTRSFAKHKGIDFTLQPEEWDDLLSRSGGRCAVSGIVFEYGAAVRGKRRPFAPSIDRVDPAGGYTPGNIRLVCTAVNIAMNDWGEAVLRRIAGAMVNPSHAC